MTNARDYAIVTAAYWAFTLTDGALRMLVLLHFHRLGYAPLDIAVLFLLYEAMGVVTNFLGGWIGARFGLRITLFTGLAVAETQTSATGWAGFAFEQIGFGALVGAAVGLIVHAIRGGRFAAAGLGTGGWLLVQLGGGAVSASGSILSAPPLLFLFLGVWMAACLFAAWGQRLEFRRLEGTD